MPIKDTTQFAVNHFLKEVAYLSRTKQVIAVTLGGLQELEQHSSAEKQHASAVDCRNQAGTDLKTFPCHKILCRPWGWTWGRGNPSMVLPAVTLACYNNNLPGKMHPIIMVKSKQSLFDWIRGLRGLLHRKEFVSGTCQKPMTSQIKGLGRGWTHT